MSCSIYYRHANLRISSLGLGCSRFGSYGGASKDVARSLIHSALDQGINHFDTAACYGQGDSERILGEYLPQSGDSFVVTKVGKVVPFKAILLSPVKRLVRAVSSFHPMAKAVVVARRPRLLSTCFNPSYLSSQLHSSLKRLRRDTVSLTMLHGPSLEVLMDGGAIDCLTRAQQKGNVQHIGVSVDDIDAANAALLDPRIEFIQIPFGSSDLDFRDWSIHATTAGKLIIAREIFRLRPDLSQAPPNAMTHVPENLRRCFDSPSICSTLIGTTNPLHLQESIDIWKSGTL
ncbi:aldo/keto reductase [Hydrogenophaga taeniospiralis]|uniref:aldo/keto reductase n=1 Tax=Hydrogenophaga taeniospiralis TaxID=65656 RepID=UPI001CF934F9|nr:aldo/keto reductase [Hydrogenophaga taeniospiralis]UCU94179.1 aldo/keto reductase [Hydrogenophaga taeniospiralis]